jgi:hypothetical protein
VADRAALEMLCTARYRGFESRPLRHFVAKTKQSSFSGYDSRIKTLADPENVASAISSSAGALI